MVAAGLETMPSLTLVTRGAQPVSNAATRVDPIGSMVWGLGRTIAREHSELRCVCVDLDASSDQPQNDLTALVEELLAADRTEHQLGFRDGRAVVPRLVRSNTRAAAGAATLPVQNADASYLVTGGLSGLGLLVARRLAESGARRLVLLSRREPNDQARQTIGEIEALGAAVTVVGADVADREALATLFNRLDGKGAPVRGVVHAAGALDDAVLMHQDWSRFKVTMAAKVVGTWNLHALTASRPLDFFVLFSSTAALIGQPGQGNYAAANAFMDGVAHLRRARGLPALAINWGPWSEVGLAARGGAAERAKSHGIEPIDPANGLSVLQHLLSSPATQVCVLDADWPRFLATFSAEQQLPLLRAMEAKAEPVAATAPASSLVDRLAAAPRHQRWPMLLDHVTTQARQVLGLDLTSAIDVQVGLRDLGLDSMMAVELRNRLQGSVGRALRSTLAFDYPSIEAIARHLSVDVLALELAAAAAASPAAQAAGEADDLLLQIESLSDDEADEMFAKANGGKA
jgi:hypothetical protein